MKQEITYARAAFTAVLAAMLLFTSCSKSVKKVPERQKPCPDEKLSREYLREGFISANTFRVVIVATENECRNDTEGIAARAKKRAYVTLQKYIISKGRNFDKNTSAQILDLINTHGTFIRRTAGCRENNIFYYDIVKEDIQDFIYHINSRNGYY